MSKRRCRRAVISNYVVYDSGTCYGDTVVAKNNYMPANEFINSTNLEIVGTTGYPGGQIRITFTKPAGYTKIRYTFSLSVASASTGDQYSIYTLYNSGGTALTSTGIFGGNYTAGSVILQTDSNTGSVYLIMEHHNYRSNYAVDFITTKIELIS